MKMPFYLVSYILGFETVEISSWWKIQYFGDLERGATSGLDEVVVIGYGQVRKSDLTGAVGSVKAEDIEKQKAPRIDQALQGRVSGVQVVYIKWSSWIWHKHPY